MILPTTCTVPLCCSVLCNLMTKFCRELFKFIFILFCGTMMQCGQIPNLVKLRDAICHNFILSPAAAYLAARIPQRGKLCISWLLPPLPSPSPSTGKSSSCERWPSLGLDPSWGVEFQWRCDSNGAQIEARQGGRTAKALLLPKHVTALEPLPWHLLRVCLVKVPIVFLCTPTPFLGRRISISRGNLVCLLSRWLEGKGEQA